MRKSVLLSFPNCEPISIKQLSMISFILNGYSYSVKSQESEYGGMIYYLPNKVGSQLYRNSFIPEITVKEETDNSGFSLNVVGMPVKSVRILVYALYIFFGLIQCGLIISSFVSALTSAFVLFIPVILCIVLFTMSTVALNIKTNSFAKVYKGEVEKIISLNKQVNQ